MDTTMTDRSGVWAEALALADVDWCQGRGCQAGSREQHVAGFRTATAVHRAFPPDEDDRAGLHAALVLVGMVNAGQFHSDEPARAQHVRAFDFATERMRAAKLRVPRDVSALRPDPEPPARSAPVSEAPEPEGEVRDASVVAEDAVTTNGEDDDDE